MNRLFGTDGIRDLAGRGKLTPENILRIGRAVGHLLSGRPELFSRSGRVWRRRRPRVLLAQDTRASGHMIRGAMISSLLASGCDLIDSGVAPAPVCSFLVRHFRCDCGVFISASHNPNEYNGIKFFDRGGFKITRVLEEAVEALVADGPPEAASIGHYQHRPDALEHYISSVVSWALRRFHLQGRRVVIDCANGAVTHVAPEVFSRLGADVHTLHADPDGTNINRGGALFPHKTAREVRRLGADVGFSFDGDGDRVIPVDETGAVLDGDFLMAICARYMKRKHRLRANTVVATVMSNIGLERSLAEARIEMVRTKVGDRHVLEEMLETGAVIGGEQSGHIIMLDRVHTGDGIWGALSLLEAMHGERKRLAELAECMERYPQVLMNVRVGRRTPFEELPDVQDALRRAEEMLEGEGRVLLRYSGTEPLARVMVEGACRRTVNKAVRMVAEAVAASLP